MRAMVVGLSGLVGLAGLVLLVAPPPSRWVSGWLVKEGLGEDAGTFTAVRGAMVRMSYVGAVTFGMFLIAGLSLQLKATAAAVALAFAVVAAAGVRVDGGARRIARLTPDDEQPREGRRPLLAATALAVLVIISSLLLAWVFRTHAAPHGSPNFGFGVALPDVTTWSLLVTAGLSLALVAAGWFARVRVHHRASLTAFDSGPDTALRVQSGRRIGAGVLGGQVVLLGIAVSAVPVLASSAGPAGQQWEVNPSVAEVAGTTALAVVALGLLVVVGGLLRSWSATRVRTPQAPVLAAGAR